MAIIPIEQLTGNNYRGNVDLSNRPRVKNQDGSISTVRSKSYNFDGQEVLLPTVSDDGRIMSDDETIANYKKTGKHLGKFGSIDEANRAANEIHNQQARQINQSAKSKVIPISELMGAPQDEIKPKKVEGLGNQFIDAAVKTPGILANSFGKTAGTVIKSVDQAVRHPINTAGAVNDAVQEGFYHPIRSGKRIIKSIGDKVQNNDPFGAILDASAVTGGAGLGLKATRIPSAVKVGDAMVDASLTPIKAANNAGKTVIKSANDLKKGGGQLITSMRDYPANKVNAIRRDHWEKYAPEEYKAFGDAIEEIPKQGGGMVDGASALQNIEKQMFEKGLMAEDGKLLLPRTTADAKFVKAYQSTYKKWALSKDGNIDINDVIGEYKNIKGEHAKKPSTKQRENTQAANDFFNSFADQIDQKSFNEAKARYRKFKENQQLTDEAIGLYDPAMKTAKGENFLTEGAISKTAQGRKTAKMITETTGQKLRGARAVTLINRVNPVSWVKR